MNKKILTLCIAFSIPTLANTDFNIIITKDNNDFTVVKQIKRETVTTEWIDVNTLSCENSINENDFYYNQVVNNKETCYQDQEREIIVKDIYLDGTEVVINTSKEYQTIIESETDNTIIGQYLSNSCNNALLFENNLTDGDYFIKINNELIEVVCDMTTDNGGWTKVSNVNANTNVVESNSWINKDSIKNGNGSYAIKFLNEINPQNIMFRNKSSSPTYGANDLIIVTRTTSNWNWTPSNFNNNNDQTARFFDYSEGTWNHLGIATYASHDENPWQQAALSFTINNIQNSYRGEQGNRLILGATYMVASSGGHWFNFYGNEASSLNNGWTTGSEGNGLGDIWMK